MADPVAIRMFESIDTDRSGALSAQELQRALALGGLQYGVSDVHAFIRAFDNQASRTPGTLDVNEFTQLYQFLGNVQQTFARHDRDRSGTLSVGEVQQALAEQGFSLSGPPLDSLIQRHDPGATGKLPLQDFLRMSLFLRGATRAFGAFDVQRTGKVALDFNQLVYAASHLP